MANQTITMSMAQFAASRMKLAQRFPAVIKAAVLAGAMRCIPIVQESTKKAPPASPNGTAGAFNTGRMHASWAVSPVGPMSVELFNKAPYSPIVEYGRRPGAKMPPLKAIEHWALRRMGLSKEEAKNAAYPIALAIKKRGLWARKVMTGVAVFAKMRTAFMLEVARRVHAAVAGVKP